MLQTLIFFFVREFDFAIVLHCNRCVHIGRLMEVIPPFFGRCKAIPTLIAL